MKRKGLNPSVVGRRKRGVYWERKDVSANIAT